MLCGWRSCEFQHVPQHVADRLFSELLLRRYWHLHPELLSSVITISTQLCKDSLQTVCSALSIESGALMLSELVASLLEMDSHIKELCSASDAPRLSYAEFEAAFMRHSVQVRRKTPSYRLCNILCVLCSCMLRGVLNSKSRWHAPILWRKSS